MDYLFQDGGKPKKTKSKTKTSKSNPSTKTTKSKSSTKTGSKTTKTTTKKSSSKKGGNFLGAVGDLVAPSGWGPFATAAGLLALDRADAALRRGKKTKSSAKKGGMRGGKVTAEVLEEIRPAIEKIESNRASPEFMRFYFKNSNYVHSNFFTVYENYFKNKDQSMSDDYYAKLQKERFHYITTTLEIVKMHATAPEPAQTNIYYGKNAGKYFTLAVDILKDITSDYNSKDYEKQSVKFTNKINRRLL